MPVNIFVSVEYYKLFSHINLEKIEPLKNGLRLAKTLSLEFFILMKLAGTFCLLLDPPYKWASYIFWRT